MKSLIGILVVLSLFCAASPALGQDPLKVSVTIETIEDVVYAGDEFGRLHRLSRYGDQVIFEVSPQSEIVEVQRTIIDHKVEVWITTLDQRLFSIKKENGEYISNEFQTDGNADALWVGRNSLITGGGESMVRLSRDSENLMETTGSFPIPDVISITRNENRFYAVQRGVGLIEFSISGEARGEEPITHAYGSPMAVDSVGNSLFLLVGQVWDNPSRLMWIKNGEVIGEVSKGFLTPYGWRGGLAVNERYAYIISYDGFSSSVMRMQYKGGKFSAPETVATAEFYLGGLAVSQ